MQQEAASDNARGGRAGKNVAVDVAELLASVPRELPHSRQRPELRYRLADDLVAVAVAGAEPAPGAGRAVEGGMTVRPVAALGATADGAVAVGPVYRRGDGGGVAVPTGQALVRFPDGDTAEAHREELAAAGYEIAQVLGYAPQAAWVRATSGSIADALSNLDRLDAVPGIENVEVQMLSEASRR